jgi:hypothetical protein
MSSQTIGPARVQTLLRRFEKTFKPYRVELTKDYGLETALSIGRHTRKEYADLLPQTPQFPGHFNLFNWVITLNVLVVALFKAMKAGGKTPEETARVLYAVSEDSHKSIPAVFTWAARKVFFSRLFLRFAQRSADRVRGHPEGWEIDYRKDDGTTCDWFFECRKCGVIKYLHRHGAAELARYCNYVDFIQSRVFGLGMQNPENIGQGDRVCRECFKQGRETLVPENLKSITMATAGRHGETWGS